MLVAPRIMCIHDLILHLLYATNDLSMCVHINYCMTNNWLKSQKVLVKMMNLNLQKVDRMIIRLIKHKPVGQAIKC